MAAVTESTPLLAERRNGDGTQAIGSQEFVQQEAHWISILNTLKATTPFLSTVTLVLIIGNYVIDCSIIGPIWYFTWYSEDALLSLAAYMFFAILLSAMNGVIRLYPLLIMVADIIFSSGIIPAAVRLFDSVPWSSNGHEDSPPTYPRGPRAMPAGWILFVKVLMGAIAALGMSLGALYAAMFILRFNGILKTQRFWERFTRLSPSGVLSANVDNSRQHDAPPEHRVQDEEAGTLFQTGENLTS